MALAQSVEGCLEATIGRLGLPLASLDANLARLEPRLAALREAHTNSTLPLLRVPEWRDDIVEAQAALKQLTHGARTLVFFGTGGSSLGGQTLAQLGGWGIPGDDKHLSRVIVAEIVLDTLKAMKLDWPKPSAEGRAAMKRVETALVKELGGKASAKRAKAKR